MNTEKIKSYIDHMWDKSILPTLMDYIRIPCKSQVFDPHWQQHGFIDKAIKLMTNWCQQNAIPDMKMEVLQEGERTPVILIEIPGQIDQTILLYGHMDKQPEMSGWDEGLAPWTPVLRDGKLYGRGGADDGYAVFASLTAIKALREQNIPHARCVILIEASEESGSIDLPYYIEKIQNRIADTNLIICLDSTCANYQQIWATTSLRGLVNGVLTVEVLKQGIHSGMGSGIVPSCFRIIRQLLNRVEDENTGAVKIPEFFVEIPAERSQQAAFAATILKESIYAKFPFQKSTQPVSTDLTELVLNQTWRPALAIIGTDGLPAIENSGNVTLPKIALKLSLRVPPGCDAKKASLKLKEILEANPPYNAKVDFEIESAASGWHAPVEEAWLKEASLQASQAFFKADPVYLGEGASIPFMGMLGKKFPQAQFVITGVLGPESNAHGPNEFLHLDTARKLTACIALIVQKHYESHAK